MKNSKIWIGLAALGLVACSGKDVNLGDSSGSSTGSTTGSIPGSSPGSKTPQVAPSLASLHDCPLLATSGLQTPVVTRECLKDDQGNFFDAHLGAEGPDSADGPAPVLPSGRKYSVVIEFSAGWVPATTTIANAAHASAVGSLMQCTAPSEGGAVLSAVPGKDLTTAETLEDNVLTIDLAGDVPSGNEVRVFLDFGGLYPWIAPGTAWSWNFHEMIMFDIDHAYAPTCSDAGPTQHD